MPSGTAPGGSLPGGSVPGSSAPGGSVPGGSASGSQAPGGGNPSSLPGSGAKGGAPASGQGALEQALEAFDGEILAERSVIVERSNRGAAGTGGGVPQPASAKPAGGGGKAASPGARTTRAPRPAPAMPGSGGGRTAGGVPDAKDDDIIARQLREAAMAEQDPVLREKLWAEYERYKGR